MYIGVNINYSVFVQESFGSWLFDYELKLHYFGFSFYGI